MMDRVQDKAERLALKRDFDIKLEEVGWDRVEKEKREIRESC